MYNHKIFSKFLSFINDLARNTNTEVKMFLTQLFDKAPCPVSRSLSVNKLFKRKKLEQNFILQITPVNQNELGDERSHHSNHDLEDVKGKG